MIKKFAKNLKHFFVYNYRVKLFCLLLAIVLWIFTASSQSLLGKFPSPIPIKIVNLSDQYQASLDTDSVQVYTMADPAVWRTLTPDSFVASIDVAGLGEGTYGLDVKVVSNVANVQITKIDPARIFVTVEKVVTKTVSVTPKVDGDPADGMIIGSIDLTPATAQVRGSSSLLNSISEANAQIRLNGESESFERDVKVIATGENSKELTGTTFTPSTVHAKISLIKGGNNKSVGIKVATKGSPKDGYYISKVTTDPALVDIAGERSTLNKIDYLETEIVDITSQSDPISKDVNLVIPTGVALQKGGGQKVLLNITFSLSSGSQSITPTIAPLNLAPGLKIASSLPADLKATVSGQTGILNTLNASNVRLEVDLTGKSAGIYNIDITPSMVKVPDGVTVTGLSATTLSLTLSDS